MKRSRINPMSANRRKKIADEQFVRRDFLRGKTCALLVMVGHMCYGPLTVHEPWTRARGGPTGDENNFVPVCSEGNRMISQDPDTMKWAEEHNLLISSAAGPEWLARGGVNG